MSQPKISIVVTGSNQGIGYEAARHLSKLPHVHLFVSGRDPNRVQEAIEKLKKEEGCEAELDSVVMDIEDAASKHVIYAAAVGLGDYVERDGLRTIFKDTFAVNSFGTAIAAEAFLPLLKRSTVGPRIVNVGSGSGSCTKLSKRGYTPDSDIVYQASKSALNSITISLALANPEVHVVVLSPGNVLTRMNMHGGGVHPSEGSKIIVDYALERKGTSPGFYNVQGELPW
ncbi:NAD(P)-binding protein [Athelia psychrophila]|uniref:NAD(P)-binding protein n=1 Tax=Athelia psychrophila TaxID=1759441 RepID=A0A166AAD6_9AGAM|nr:NAD(P)-binding protein [Fibularhizoctonia sp. CBS 109695]